MQGDLICHSPIPCNIAHSQFSRHNVLPEGPLPRVIFRSTKFVVCRVFSSRDARFVQRKHFDGL